MGYNREAKALRELYFRMKLHAKSSIRKYKSARTKTGGGLNEAATPSDLDWALMSIAPEDFKKDDSNFDSDAIVCINATERTLMHCLINYTSTFNRKQNHLEAESLSQKKKSLSKWLRI